MFGFILIKEYVVDRCVIDELKEKFDFLYTLFIINVDLRVTLRTIMKIAFGYQSRVGKDHCAEYLVSKHMFIQLSFASLLKECAEAVQECLGKKVKKDPKLLQLLGEGLRNHYGEDIFIQPVVSEISENTDERYVVSDLRYKNEAAELKKLGFICIKIVREDRVIDRDVTHPSEVGLADFEFDHTIVNDGTLTDLENKLERILDSVGLNKMP